jgi:D-inositol-3-phosphate glycosyltransferase
MKIAVVVNFFAPHIGGLEEVAKKQVESLVSLGHEVTVITCRPNSHAPLTEQKDGYIIKRIRNLNIIEQKFGITFPIVSPHYIVWFLKELRKYDVVHIHEVFYMISHMAAFGVWVLRKPMYLTQHVAIVDHPSKLVVLVQSMVYKIFGTPIFRLARKIVCYNTNVRDFLCTYRGMEHKILLNYNGIDTAFFTPGLPEEKKDLRQKYNLPTPKPIALFVGRLVPKKGYDIVHKAASSEYHTLIVGAGDQSVTLQSSKDVTFFGPATPSQLQELYRLSDVFVFPAIGEIFTLVMQEAMASGLPIITTNDQAYHGTIDPAMVALVERNSNAVKKSIQKIVADRNLKIAMSNYSRSLAEERFSWKNNYQREIIIYESEIA